MGSISRLLTATTASPQSADVAAYVSSRRNRKPCFRACSRLRRIKLSPPWSLTSPTAPEH